VSTAEVFLLVVGVLVALAIGSFTCVVIDRLPYERDEPDEYGDTWGTRPWREVLGGTSRCSSCGAGVRPRDNIPVLGWLLLRGRCRDCRERIPSFHPVVEMLAPVGFLLSVWAIGWDWRLLPVLWLIPVGLAVSVIDLRTLIVPTRIVWPAPAVSVVVSVVAVAAGGGEWAWLVTAAVGAAALSAPLFLVWFIHPRGMGFGDVRLSVLLGWIVGFYAGSRPAAGLIGALLVLAIGSIVGVVMGVVVLGARGRKAQVPFGPSLVLGAFTCALLAEPLLDPFGVYSLV
jgi:leader peptidase (prepilin peptidase) / N-methyltransferase